MWCSDAKTVTAKVQHRCTSCGEPIEIGEKYKKWASFDDSTFTNKMHPECLAMHDEDAEGGTWEYMPYSHDRPNMDLETNLGGVTPNVEFSGAREAG